VRLPDPSSRPATSRPGRAVFPPVLAVSPPARAWKVFRARCLRAARASPREDEATLDPKLQTDDSWDAGDMGCGELVFELAQRLAALRPGQALLLVATDLGAPHDIPAWCRLTGHPLVAAEHPRYLIRRKES